MYRVEHPLRETCEYFLDRETTITEQAEKKLRERENEVDEFKAQVNKYREQRELKNSELGKLTEAVYNNHLQTALEAIYITAINQDSILSENSIELAHKLVENYINDKGGAREIIRRKSGKTYLLDTIFEAVDHAAKRDIEAFFEAEKEDEKEDKKEKEKKNDDKSDKEDIKLGDNDGDGVDDAQDSDFGTGEDNKKNAEASDSKEKSDVKEDEKEESDKDKEKEEEKGSSSEENGEDIDGDGDDDSEEEPEEDEEESDKDSKASVDDLDNMEEELPEDSEEQEVKGDEAESDPVLDEPDTKESIEDAGEPEDMEEDEEEEPSSSKEELFDKLESDTEVSDAVDIIAKRISDAEAKFIEKNAEDKKKIENIVNKVQDRIDAVTQDEDSTPEEIESEEQEAQIESTRLINEIRNDRFHTVYEMMVRDNMDYIMKNKTITESYMDEGKIDMSKVMDSSRVMYGWLETVNTIQLDNVNEEYIQKVLEGKI